MYNRHSETPPNSSIHRENWVPTNQPPNKNPRPCATCPLLIRRVSPTCLGFYLFQKQRAIYLLRSTSNYKYVRIYSLTISSRIPSGHPGRPFSTLSWSRRPSLPRKLRQLWTTSGAPCQPGHPVRDVNREKRGAVSTAVDHKWCVFRRHTDEASQLHARKTKEKRE